MAQTAAVQVQRFGGMAYNLKKQVRQALLPAHLILIGFRVDLTLSISTAVDSEPRSGNPTKHLEP